MTRRLPGSLVVLYVSFSLAAAQAPAFPPDKEAVERGALAVRTALNPATVTLSTFENLWKQWGLKERPDDFAPRLRQHYGLYPAAYDNDGLPMGLKLVQGVLGKGVTADCLLCHAGSVAGKTIIGVGNASFDLQGLFDDFNAGQPFAVPSAIKFSRARGTIEAVAAATFLMEFRDADLNLRAPTRLNIKDDLCEDVPAWWLMKKKKTMYHTGLGHARSVRTMMTFLLNPLNSANYIKKLEPLFADIQAYLLTLEAPKYPFAINQDLAARGEGLFNKSCAKCHGSYGAEPSYPSKVVPLKTIGTDPCLADGGPVETADHYLKGWFAQEKGPDGKPFPRQTVRGYQAPPLDGVWATAPYFHNASVPTVYHVLNSRVRPKIFTRSFRTEVEDFDAAKLGLKTTVLEQLPDVKMPARERRQIYDTTQPGRGNAGHTFGDHFTDDERRAVIEYLKTL